MAWAGQPKGCRCDTLDEARGCYERCDDVLLEYRDAGARKAFWYGVLAFVAILFLACIAFTGKARADSSVACQYGRHFVNCVRRTITPPATPTPEELEAKAGRIQKWESFCQPKPVVDKYGVTRMEYAHDGCDFGRSQ